MVAAQRADTVLVFGEPGGELELPVHSLVLSLASPVFDAMLSTGMAECESRRVRVQAASMEEFEEFYQFLLPLKGRSMVLSERNVDSVLVLSDYYQVDQLKEECAAVLEGLPVTVGRLLQAKRHGLTRQYERCADSIAEHFGGHELGELACYEEVLMDIVTRAQRFYGRMQERLAQIGALRPEVQRLRDRTSRGDRPLPAEDPWAGGQDPWAGGWYAARDGSRGMLDTLDALLRLIAHDPEHPTRAGGQRLVPPPPPALSPPAVVRMHAVLPPPTT